MRKIILIFSIITLFFSGCKKDDIFEKGTLVNVDGHVYVDLGLPSGTKWAICNVGADSPEEYGSYFAWGETKPAQYNKYDYSTCSTYEISLSELKSRGYIDGNGNLKAQYDAATANWGGSWRMPTYDELEELENNCTWTWTTQNGVNGYNVNGPSGASIFLPAAGYRSGTYLSFAEDNGAYWCSSPSNDKSDAYHCSFGYYGSSVRETYRYRGLSVRPVLNENFEPELPDEPEEPEQPEEPEEPEQPEYVGETETISVNGVSFIMVKVEGGTFYMGTTSEQDSDPGSDEKPIHNVTLSDYYIGETEVTQELWETVMKDRPSYFFGNNRPVENISYSDCQEFIAKLNQLTGKNFRLPTEAEWEYAARGGNKSKGYKYSGSNVLENVAWYTNNSGSTTHEVKTKQANELGIYDMSGNVYEWCYDWYGSYSSSTQTDPIGAPYGSKRVLRGGSWNDAAWSCRGLSRYFGNPANAYKYNGFRLCLSLENEEDISGTENGHDYVDLGLPSGLKWASCNVGAIFSEEYGDYFAWGEINTKETYYYDNSSTYGLSYSQLKYQGYIDSCGNLKPQYDAARAKWGGNWRMPTKAEQEELLNNCTWTWTTQNGVNGYNVEGPNGNSIFLPAAGQYDWSSLDDAGSNGYYWSSTPNEYYDYRAYYLDFGSGNHNMSDGSRCYGQSVRPVLE